MPDTKKKNRKLKLSDLKVGFGWVGVNYLKSMGNFIFDVNVWGHLVNGEYVLGKSLDL